MPDYGNRTEQNTTEKGSYPSYDAPAIRVYGDTNAGWSYVDSMYNYAVNAMEYAYSNGYISGFKVWSYTSDFDPACSEEILPQMEDWRSYGGFDEDGVHLMVVDCSLDYVANGVSDSNDAWQGPSDVMTSNNNGERSKAKTNASGLHETIHSFALSKCSNVQDMMTKERDGTGWNEHTLGRIKDEVDGLTGNFNTPMLGGDYAATHGECKDTNDSTDRSDPETYKLCTCEMKALRESAEHSDGRH